MTSAVATAGAQAAGAVVVRWSLADYIARVIVDTACETAQSVRAVALEPFALTLWTWGHLRRRASERSVERLGERTDSAGLMATAFHDPKSLRNAELRYLSEAGLLQQTIDSARARGLAVAAAAEAATRASTPTQE